MVYFSESTNQTEIGVCTSQCPLCGEIASLKISKVHRETWVFIIPSWSNKFYITCGNCWQSFKIDNKIGKELEFRSKHNNCRCPTCNSITALKTVKKGKDKGKKYYVCSNYPECKGRIKA